MSTPLLRQGIRPVSLALTAGTLALGLTYYTLNHTPLRADTSEPMKTFTGGPAFLSLSLESTELVNHNTRRLRFSLPDKDAVSGLPLTSALLTMSWPKDRWVPVLRPYTPISSNDEPGHLDFLIKHYPNGRSSTHLHSLVPGDKLLFVAALKGHQWQPNSYKHVSLIAGGAGITPLFQLARGILGNPSDGTAVTLVLGVNADEDVLLREEFARMERDFPGRFRATYTVSRPGEGSPYRKGKVTKELLEEVLPKVEDGQDTKIFVCGPPAMETALVGGRGTQTGILEQLGYSKGQIHRF